MPDIIWRSPAETAAFLKTKKNITVIFLVENTDESYDLFTVFKDGDKMWADASLAAFSCPEFNPFKYNMLAIVASQE